MLIKLQGSVCKKNDEAQSLLCAALAGAALVAGQAVAAPLSLSNADFETGDLSGWSTLGSVFATPSTSVRMIL